MQTLVEWHGGTTGESTTCLAKARIFCAPRVNQPTFIWSPLQNASIRSSNSNRIYRLCQEPSETRWRSEGIDRNAKSRVSRVSRVYGSKKVDSERSLAENRQRIAWLPALEINSQQYKFFRVENLENIIIPLDRQDPVSHFSRGYLSVEVVNG